jgi:hypothetical protein
MANYFVYCFIFNLTCCFAMPRIGDRRLGKQVIRLVILVGLHGDLLCVYEHNFQIKSGGKIIRFVLGLRLCPCMT